MIGFEFSKEQKRLVKETRALIQEEIVPKVLLPL